MKTMLRGTILVSILLILSAPLFAGGAQETDFLAELRAALEDEGLSEEETQAVADAATSYDWSGMNRVDPETIAEAVVRVQEEGVELSAEERAELARELSESAAELREDGYSRSEVAEATLAAVDELQAQIQAWKDGDQEEPLGETVRNTVSERARETARERATESQEGREAARERETESQGGEPDDTPASDKAPAEAGEGASSAGNR